MIRFLSIALLMLLSVFSFPNTVYAAQGSIEVTLEKSQHAESRKDVVFGITKLADVKDGRLITIKGKGIDAMDFNTIKHASDMQTMMDEITPIVPVDQTYRTDENGYFKAEGLDLGLYLLQCLDHKDYDQVQSTMVVIPSYNESTHEMEHHLFVVPKHTPNKKLMLKKKDGQTKQGLLSDETIFTLYQDQACKKVMKSVHTDAKTGYAVFENMHDGTYYLKEVQAAKGYQKLNHTFKIEVKKDMLTIDGKEVSIQGDAYEYDVYNMKKEQVHTMDQSHKHMYMILGIAMLPCLYICYRKAKA